MLHGRKPDANVQGMTLLQRMAGWSGGARLLQFPDEFFLTGTADG